jgi:molybdenum cofactor cytidylyltransferase
MSDVWAIVLAAGASSRMGTQKLLLPFGDKTVIEKIIEQVESVVSSDIVVVIGSHRDEIQNKIGKPQLKFIHNELYMEGMLSSVICGFQALPDEAKAALVYLGDQPQIPAGIALQVISAWKQSGKGIVIPVFSGKRGHPVLIETRYMKEIEQLDPEQGLRMLSKKFSYDVQEVECTSQEILRDIDTPEDYQKEINKTK